MLSYFMSSNVNVLVVTDARSVKLLIPAKVFESIVPRLLKNSLNIILLGDTKSSDATRISPVSTIAETTMMGLAITAADVEADR
jgi:hypothetical protein